MQRLATLVRQVRAARDRRPANDALVAVLAVLEADHPYDAHAAPDAFDDRLAGIRDVYGLDALDVDLLVAACAPELDANFGLAYALLQGDPARVRPGAALALELCDVPWLAPERSRLAAGAPLRQHDLLTLPGDEPFPHRTLRVPDRLVAHLAGDDTPDPLVATMTVDPVAVPVPEAVAAARAIEAGVPLVWVRAAPGSVALGLAAAAFDTVGIAHLAVDLGRCPGGEPVENAVRAATRESALLRSGLVVTGAAVLAEPANVWLLELLDQAPVPVVAVADRPWGPAWLRALPFAVDAPPVTASVRDELWRELLGDAADQPGWAELVSLRLTPEDIVRTAAYAGVVAATRQEDVSVAGAREAARRLVADTARPRAAVRTFADLVLPPATLEAVRELVGWAAHRDLVPSGNARGVTALFTGNPGTGKTLAAEVVAAELGLDLRTVDLSAVVDKYIGETEKNLERAFAEAERHNVLLFFDEADALFGNRSEVRDARDRYANQEIAYLLQRMEQFDGIAVLATNLRGNLDAAFTRRLHFVVHFPDPDAPTRRRLWETHLAPFGDLDPADPVDLDRLAETVEVSGGDIRNAVLAAAHAAVAEGVPLGMRHVVRGVVREYRKLGRRLPVPGLLSAG
ncbi:MAG TPA: ATP-binding protein [Frankiaceae bacterium]|nr:ATP-binding protein [Frankiaceae bacterium]